VERCGVDESAFVEVANVPVGQSSTVVSGLAVSALYDFRVRARNRFGTSESATVAGWTPTDERGSNLLARAKASASSIQEGASGGEAAAANDGRMDTRWTSAEGQTKNQWLVFEFAEPVRLCAVVINQDTKKARIAKYRIQLWVNDAWKDSYQGNDMPEVALCRFDPTTTAKVRVSIEQTNNGTPTIMEVLAFAAGGEPGK